MITSMRFVVPFVKNRFKGEEATRNFYLSVSNRSCGRATFVYIYLSCFFSNKDIFSVGVYLFIPV